MSKKFTFLISLPGGGKTFLANQMQQKDPNIAVIDDISRMVRVDYKNLKIYEILAQFPEYSEFILSDPAFCEDSFRVRVIEELNEVFGEVEYEFIYFENNPEQCLRNVELRDDGRKVTKYIERLSKMYVIPDGAKTIPVWRPDS